MRTLLAWSGIALLLGVTPVAVGASGHHLPAEAARGFVVEREANCDYFLVETTMGYALLEWHRGNDPDEGDELVGSFEAYGFKDILNVTADAELRIWVEDYWLGKADALEQLHEQCD